MHRCNVDRMKLLKKPLPINGYEEVWMRINKVIGIKLSQIYIKLNRKA